MLVKAKDMLSLLGLPLLMVAVSVSEPASPATSVEGKTSPVSSDASDAKAPSETAVTESGPGADEDRLILVLRTRGHRIIVFGGDRSPKYTVHDAKGVLLAREMDSAVLKERFPALHEVATGVAWSGIQGSFVARGN
jgi:hypothetical protein